MLPEAPLMAADIPRQVEQRGVRLAHRRVGHCTRRGLRRGVSVHVRNAGYGELADRSLPPVRTQCWISTRVPGGYRLLLGPDENGGRWIRITTDAAATDRQAAAVRRYRCTVLREQSSSVAMASIVQPSAWSRAAWTARSGTGGSGFSRPSAPTTTSRSSGLSPPYQPQRMSVSSARSASAKQARRAPQPVQRATTRSSGRPSSG